MPIALEYLEPNNIKRKELGGKEEREARTKVYTENRDYYLGTHPKWLIQEDDVDDNITVNVTKQAIDRTLSFLFPDLPLFQLDPNKVSEDEKWLNSVFRFNGGAYFLSSLAHNGSLSGHNYVKIIPPKTNADFPRLVAMNPTVPITYWRADDPDTVLWHELLWEVGKDLMLQDYVNTNGTWTIKEYIQYNTQGAWVLSDVQPKWNAPYPPIIAAPHLPNPNEYYGTPEVTDNSRDLNDAINRVASDIGKILRYHASPRTIGIGFTANELKPSAIDSFWTIADPNAKVQNLEMQSDLASSMNFLTYLNDTFLALSRVVIMKGTVKDFQRVTNTGIRAVFLDMIAKNELLRWSYGILLQKIAQSVLYVGNRATKDLPGIVWADPLPSDELETVNRMAIEQGNGWLDPETASGIRGYEWGTIRTRWEALVKLDFIDKLLFGGSKDEGGQATRLAKTDNNKIAS